MSNNAQPNAPNPKLWHDPDTIRFQDLYKYVGRDQLKINQTLRNLKGSAIYVGSILAGCLVYKGFVDGFVNSHVFGENGNGGTILNLRTTNNTYDYYYNREFQRMRYLSEEPQGMDANLKTKDEVLVDLGVTLHQRGLNKGILKKSPHYKYF